MNNLLEVGAYDDQKGAVLHHILPELERQGARQHYGNGGM